MKYSRLYLQDSESSSTAHTNPGMARLIQGGYIREIGPGLFSFLPIGLRVMHNIIEVIRNELLTLEGYSRRPLGRDGQGPTHRGRNNLPPRQAREVASPLAES